MSTRWLTLIALLALATIARAQQQQFILTLPPDPGGPATTFKRFEKILLKRGARTIPNSNSALLLMHLPNNRQVHVTALPGQPVALMCLDLAPAPEAQAEALCRSIQQEYTGQHGR